MNHNFQPSPQQPDIMDALRHAVSTTTETYGRRLEGDNREAVVAALKHLDILGIQQSSEAVQDGISNAKRLIETHQAEEVLKTHAFVSEEDLKPYLGNDEVANVDVAFDDPVLIDWSKIDGAVSFNSWLGRGDQGDGQVADRQVSKTNRSKDVIFDYASRNTPLPPIDLYVILTDEGPRVMASNSHTSAAAILRQETITSHLLRVIDTRKSF